MLFGGIFKRAATVIDVAGVIAVTAALALGALSVISFPLVLAVGGVGLVAHIAGGVAADKRKKALAKETAPAEKLKVKKGEIIMKRTENTLDKLSLKKFSPVAKKQVPVMTGNKEVLAPLRKQSWAASAVERRSF